MGADLQAAQALVEAAAARAAAGDGLDERERALVRFALACSPTVLDVAALHRYAPRALELGAEPEALTEAMLLVALVGNHALHEGARAIAEALGDGWTPSAEQQALRDAHVGDDAYWRRLEDELPGFLDGLLRLSPAGFAGFFAACAVPFRGRALDPLLKELICVGLDATPSHRYLPGLRLHLDNSLRLGATAGQLRDVARLAAGAGEHPGVA